MNRRGILLLGSTTLVGAVLRIVSPGRIALWRDEMQALNIAGLPSLAEITRFLYHHESHPPLFYFLEHLAARLTGDPVRSMGILTLLASVALIPAAWWLASLSRVRRAATLAAILIAVSLPLAFFGVELRPYSLFSLAALLGAAAILQDRTRPSPWWRMLWAVMALCLVYVHHVGTIVVASQLIAAFALVPPNSSRAAYGRLLTPFIGVVAIASIPALIMLAHQAAIAGYPPRRPGAVWGPIHDFADLMLAFPGEIGLGFLGAAACLVWGGRRSVPTTDEQETGDQSQMVPLQALVACGLIVMASYRSNLLVEWVVLSIAPLGLVSTGIILATAMKRRWRWRSVMFCELAIAGVALSMLAFLGKGKTDTDLVAAYVGAEAFTTDLLIVAPGAIGPSFNRYFRGEQEQIDFPEMTAVSRFKFDHYVARVQSAEALRVARDSILSACRAGRRVWLIVPTQRPEAESSRLLHDPDGSAVHGPGSLEREGEVADFLMRVFGAPRQVSQPSPTGAGVEVLMARVWGPAVFTSDSETGRECPGE